MKPLSSHLRSATALVLIFAGVSLAAPSDNCEPALPDPVGAWQDVALPSELQGMWFYRNIYNIGIFSSHAQISNLSWEYLAIQKQGGIYRLIVRSGAQYRGQYYLILGGTGGPGMACLVSTASTDVVASETAARTNPPGDWHFLAPEASGTFAEGVSWMPATLPDELKGMWWYAGIYNIGIFDTHAQISNYTWEYVSIGVRCGPGLGERIYRIVFHNLQVPAEYRAHYYRCIDPCPKGTQAYTVLTAPWGPGPQAEVLFDRPDEWHPLTNLLCWSTPIEPTSWGRLKSLYR